MLKEEHQIKEKTPWKPVVWDNIDSDNIIWNTHYQTGDEAVLNNSVGNIFDWNDENQKPGLEPWRDTFNSMKGRRVK